MNKIDELAFILEKANQVYRTGNTLWFSNQGLLPPTDKEYDDMIDSLAALDPKHEFLTRIGFTVPDSKRKQPLPVAMLSADKIHTLEEIHKWMSRYNIPPDAFCVLTPKLDGLSLLTDESKQPGQELRRAWTRGDGSVGQTSDTHFAAIEANSDVIYPFYSMGEALISKKNYDMYYRGKTNPKTNEPWGPARNIAAGAFNKEIPDSRMAHIHYIRFGIQNFDGTRMDKSDQLELCNKLNMYPLPYRTLKFRELTTELLDKYFKLWRVNYDIDGIILDVDNADLRHHLGTHVSGKYPNYMVAYKDDNEEVQETTVLDIQFQISKQGLAKPVFIVEPVSLDGAIVRRVTGNNMQFVVGKMIGPGSKIKIKRSGFVVPKVVEVIETADVIPAIAKGCPVCGSELIWGEANDKGIQVDMECANPECDGKMYKRLLSFFTTLQVPDVGPGTIDILYQAGYTTVNAVLQMTIKDLQMLEGFGPRKATIVHDAIAAIIVNVPISKLQHASGFFSGLGSRKLKVINEAINKKIENTDVFNDISNRLNRIFSPGDIVELDGFAIKSADVYINGIGAWWRWLTECNLHSNVDWTDGNSNINKSNTENMVQTLTGHGVVFTGFRDADLEAEATARGAEIKSGVSKNSSILVMKVTGSGSGKERKALGFGQEIYSREEFIEKYIV